MQRTPAKRFGERFKAKIIIGYFWQTRLDNFSYADEHHADGKMKVRELYGSAHGEFYAQLAAH